MPFERHIQAMPISARGVRAAHTFLLMQIDKLKHWRAFAAIFTP